MTGARKRRARILRKRFDHGEPISRIDTRPMVFVVMLVFIMLIFPAGQIRVHALVIDLPVPQPQSRLGPLSPPSNLVFVEPDGTIRWNGVIVSESNLRENLRRSARQPHAPALLFEPDGSTGYGEAANVLRIIWEEGAATGCFIFKDVARYRRFDDPASWEGPVEYSPRDCVPMHYDGAPR